MLSLIHNYLFPMATDIDADILPTPGTRVSAANITISLVSHESWISMIMKVNHNLYFYRINSSALTLMLDDI